MTSDSEEQWVGYTGALGEPLKAILAAAGTPGHSFSSGSAAALSVALAAALACSVARSFEPGAEATGFAIQAENLRMRAVDLIEQNRAHYEVARQALDARLRDPGYRDYRIGQAMGDTLDTLRLIAGTGADAAELAAEVAETAPAELKPDAASAAALAESGTRVATMLIGANLLSAAGGEALAAAEGELAIAIASSRRARELIG